MPRRSTARSVCGPGAVSVVGPVNVARVSRGAVGAAPADGGLIVVYRAAYRHGLVGFEVLCRFLFFLSALLIWKKRPLGWRQRVSGLAS